MPSCPAGPTRPPFPASAGTCRAPAGRRRSWPPPGARELRLYLAEPGLAAGDAPGGTLAGARGCGEAAWAHDPQNPVPSTIVNPFAAVFEFPDEREVEARDDVLVFTTPAWDSR